MQNETLEAHEPELHSGETKDAPVANVLESREEAREAFEARSLDFFEDLLPEDTEEFSGIEDHGWEEKAVRVSQVINAAESQRWKLIGFSKSTSVVRIT